MEDYKRFLRYVIRGLVFIIEVPVYLLLSEFERFICLIKINSKNVVFLYRDPKIEYTPIV